ncbi:hypothetical protein ACFVSW_10220 [Neobacillus sp. NPDC058068]|uniref:hypothetical protein n=1 Tax=Neobacillus sp. NPDC058068 TaxID=3346325 RepID=UPI0036D9AA31
MCQYVTKNRCPFRFNALTQRGTLFIDGARYGNLQLMTPDGPYTSNELGTIYTKNGHHYLQVTAQMNPDKMVEVTSKNQ